MELYIYMDIHMYMYIWSCIYKWNLIIRSALYPYHQILRSSTGYRVCCPFFEVVGLHYFAPSFPQAQMLPAIRLCYLC